MNRLIKCSTHWALHIRFLNIEIIREEMNNYKPDFDGRIFKIIKNTTTIDNIRKMRQIQIINHYFQQ